MRNLPPHLSLEDSSFSVWIRPFVFFVLCEDSSSAFLIGDSSSSVWNRPLSLLYEVSSSSFIRGFVLISMDSPIVPILFPVVF